MAPPPAERPRLTVIACAAIAREVRGALAAAGLPDAAVEVRLLPSALHNRPERIPAAVVDTLDALEPGAPAIVAYADCGTGGALDRALAGRGVARLPGAHCYELVAGPAVFAALHDEEPGTFYLTEFLARHAEQLVIVGLGLDRHPELRDAYFGHYRRVVLLAPRADDDLVARGRALADRLGLDFEVRVVGEAPFADAFTTALAMPVTVDGRPGGASCAPNS